MINKKYVLSFIKSTLIVILFSTILATGVFLSGGNFLAAFLMAAVTQYIIFSFVGGIIKNYYIQQTRQKEIEKLEQLSTLLECAYCKHLNVITFIPDQNQRIEFDCDKCTKRNVVTMNFTVARVTDTSITMPVLPESKNE
jgi:hypothetical protein